MDKQSIPVSFDFFKKYTYHEEWVDFILKKKAKGNQQLYESLRNSAESREKALRSYYEAFYLRPKIRKKHHIQIKPVPKNIKNKLLVIPLLNAGTGNENVKAIASSEVVASALEKENFSSSNASPQDNGARVMEKDVTKENPCNCNIGTIAAAADIQPCAIASNTEIQTISENELNTIVLDEGTANLSSNIRKGKNYELQEKANAADSIGSTIPVTDILQKSFQLTPTSTRFPVSLEEFKKFTHYEEIVDNLFKVKSQNNEELYLKYVSSQEAFQITLLNFYQAFYMLPVIRELCPIRLKPAPKFLRKRLLSLPKDVRAKDTSNFKVEQLVAPINEMKISSAENLLPSHSIEKTSMEQRAHMPSSTITTATDQEQPDAEKQTKIPAVGIKRPSNSIIEPSLSKRTKTGEDSIAYSTNSEKTEKPWKKLLPYAHCCPVTFSEFNKYTNIKELFSGCCKKLYNSLKKLRNILYRAYILFYLAPENRQYKPLNNLKILDTCPSNLRDKIFAIPQKLHYKREIIVPLDENNVQANGHQTNNAAKSNIKQHIQILENRLLPPASLKFLDRSNKDSHLCAETTCFFHHVSYSEQMNILNISSEPQEKNHLQNTFKKFIFDVIKGEISIEKLTVDSALLYKLYNYKICGNCANYEETTKNLDRTTASSISENDRHSDVSIKTVIERIQPNPPVAFNKQPANSNPVIEKRENLTESLTKNLQAEPLLPSRLSSDLWNHLRSDKLFAKFCAKLLLKINQLCDNTVDLSSDNYKIFLHCNEIPLPELLKTVFENNEDIVQRVLKQTELSEAFQRYYYCKYLRDEKFAIKYPLKIKQTDSSDSNKKLQESNTDGSNVGRSLKTVTAAEVADTASNTLIRTEINPISFHAEAAPVTNSREIERSLNNDTALGEAKTVSNTSMKMESNPNPLTVESTTATSAGEAKITINNDNVLEKAKSIFFRYFDKSHSLAYVLRTSFGYKQAILKMVLNFTFDEFLEVTSIYEGEELYNDNHIAECMYRYVFRSPFLWPTNLYIPPEKLLKLLQKNNIPLKDHSTILTYISPKLLHWSSLLSCTNILDCIKIDFEKRTGKVLNTYDTRTLKNVCINYYNRCWKYEKWQGETPRICEEFYKNVLSDNDQDNITMLPESFEVELCRVTSGTTNNVSATENVAADIKQNSDVTTTSHADQEHSQFKCIFLPNTQHQIDMLPSEANFSGDPLASTSNLDTLTTSEVVAVGVQSQPIKTESLKDKFLSNIFFYEVDDGNIQDIHLEDEIVCLDSTISTESVEGSLPPLEINFSDEAVGEIIFPSVHNELVKQEPPESKFLSNIIFYEDEDNNIQAINIEEEIVSLESSLGTDGVEGNLPSLEINFNEFELPEHANKSTSAEHLTQNICDPAGSNDLHLHSLQYPKSTLAQESQLPAISFQNSNENESENQKTSATQCADKKNILCACEMGKEFSKIENSANTQEYSQNYKEQQENKNSLTALEENVFINLCDEKPSVSSQAKVAEKKLPEVVNKQQQVNVVGEKIYHCITTFVPSTTFCENRSQSCMAEARLPLHRGTTKTFLIKRGLKNVATVKPLTNSGLVPQIQHNARPLQTVPVYSVSSSHNNNAIRSLPEIPTSTSVMIRLTQSSHQNANSTGPTTQNSHFETEVPNLGTHIYVSQEMNKNSSLFNDSSLLRISDHNYHKGVMQNFSQINDSGHAQNQQQYQPGAVILRSTSDKVNNSNLTHNNNHVTAITVIIHQPYPCKYQMGEKVILHRCILKFHYFKEVTSQDIIKYILPNPEVGKSYSEALISCENFKTRISNRSISVLFPFWSHNIQRDFLLVLDDLKEFHYARYERDSIQKKEDLRVRILFHLLNTAPAFSLCKLNYNINNSEFSNCSSVNSGNDASYNRKPFQCLTNALCPKLLTKLRKIKEDLNCK